MENGNRKDVESINKDELIDYLIKMRADTIVLTDEALHKLAGLKFENPVGLVQFVFYKGFNEAVSHLLQLVGQKCE